MPNTIKDYEVTKLEPHGLREQLYAFLRSSDLQLPYSKIVELCSGDVNIPMKYLGHGSRGGKEAIVLEPIDPAKSDVLQIRKVLTDQEKPIFARVRLDTIADEKMLTVNKLQEILDVEKVDIRRYSLNGGRPEDGYGLSGSYGNWTVYYSERGIEFEKVKFISEHEACEYFLKTVRRELD